MEGMSASERESIRRKRSRDEQRQRRAANETNSIHLGLMSSFANIAKFEVCK